ncbi:TPA: GPW/gp25 family protein [Salmonella enterica subsp. enterica serovar Java]|uniref:Baseplate assembly protein n=2 Tax=Salmonella enterica TaxID=28901 RepID=A0A505CXP1_SALER|nr:GPW/gp25 family protein [Salmonella enterica]EBH8149462.1 baseplate assembly protein [Salmonella enterica subsp. enterica serovar Bareilly str. CFSAN000189]EHL2769429.1 GPW/gp25 family protein [Salmonella enterica subsp. enterica serovar Hvittingfoss]ATW54220.1 baseplate assembly protein [Salmonella enterica subsp. diarizonae]EBI3721230.1 baseplate assembly protein [Salmonella enterica]EHL2847727.1 GPW/gp25 family protein [Salmonella enterica subsp. enterica serovar Hvittingfoss]
MLYLSIDRHTGKTLTDADHIRQSIQDIITTPTGTRVMRRDYGSLISELIDAPVNDALPLQLMAAIFDAIIRQEPRVTVTEIQLRRSENGLTADIGMMRTDTGESITFPVSVRG